MRRKLSAIALVVGLVVNAAVRAQGPPGATSLPPNLLEEFWVMRLPHFLQLAVRIPAVQEELKITEAQKTEVEATINRLRAQERKARREIADPLKIAELRETILRETHAAIREKLEPWQRDRLDQILLQAQGPLAFNRAGYPQMAVTGPDPGQQLKLTDEQVKRVQTISEEGYKEVATAACVPIVFDPNAGAPDAESIRKFVVSPEFKTAKQQTRETARKRWDSTIQRIEQVLTESQRTAYHEMLGVLFDLSKFRRSEDESAEDLRMVAVTLKVAVGGGGQQADPNFDTKVARPAYVNQHPPILFDEAHNNFHTADGRYKPFAEIITNDGYRVIPNREKFTREVLAKGKILIIANALGSGADAGASAFSDGECDAVRDWVQAGGSLLLITDHAPFGSAAESLAKRFGVDMSKGFTSDASNSEGSASDLVFSRKNNLLGDHPITSGRDASERINRIQTFTGQSLKGPAGSVALLKLADTAEDQRRDEKPTSAAGRAQGLAFVFGKGRVVVLGEAAELSAQLLGKDKFGMNVPGLDNRQMALNIMHWLSGLLEPHGGLEKKAG